MDNGVIFLIVMCSDDAAQEKGQNIMRSVFPVRVPSLIVGEVYDAMVWQGKRQIVEGVRFCYFFNGVTGTVSEKIPQINKMHASDRVQFIDAAGKPFTGMVLNACLVDSVSGKRLTFSKGSVAPHSELEAEAVAEYPEAVQPVADVSEGVVDVDAKLIARRERDAKRKRLARQRAKEALQAA